MVNFILDNLKMFNTLDNCFAIFKFLYHKKLPGFKVPI